jgi:hypothetical protein
MGGDDLIDGDKWLNVRVSVHQNVDGTGPEIASYDSLAPLIPLMLNGTYNPGQLVATREIMNGVGGFDTAVYRGNIGDYIITINNNNTPLNFSDDVVTVADNRAAPIDGIDHLTHMERLVFQDATVDLVPGLDAGPVGRPTITDTNGGAFTVGDFVTVSIAGVTDADNPNGGAITGPVRYTWQVDDGTGVFDDIILLPGGDLAFESASGTSFRLTPDLAGLSIRVKAIYTDAHGVTEMVFSDATTPVAAAPAAPLVAPPTTPDPSMSEGGPGIKLVRSDLDLFSIKSRLRSSTPSTVRR